MQPDPGGLQPDPGMAKPRFEWSAGGLNVAAKTLARAAVTQASGVQDGDNDYLVQSGHGNTGGQASNTSRVRVYPEGPALAPAAMDDMGNACDNIAQVVQNRPIVNRRVVGKKKPADTTYGSDGQDATRIIGDGLGVPSRATIMLREFVGNNATAPAVSANQNAQQPSWMETALSEQAEIMDERYTHSRVFVQEDIVEDQIMGALPDARRETPEGSTHSTSEPEDENSPMRPYQLD